MYLFMQLIPVLLPTLVIRTVCENNTNSDVIIIRSSGHADAEYPDNKKQNEFSEILTTKDGAQMDFVTAKNFYITSPPIAISTQVPPEITEGVVFIPNEAPIRRLEDIYERTPLRIEDVMKKESIGDVMNHNIQMETESPHDVVFISAKNNDYVEKKKAQINLNIEDNKRINGRRKMEKEKETPAKLDCTNLDCNNTINSICGLKKINREIKYRLFLNDCYFRKVNCNFRNEINRYTLVSLDKCDKIGAHYSERPYIYKPLYLPEPKVTENLDGRKTFSSRRSMSVNMNGGFCSHVCPIHCPDDYEPECAISVTGQKKVFMNHCKLDDNSCLYSVVWHQRPLSDCVGGLKAELRQNRYFIDWMQRVGIVDRRGKLLLQ